MGYSVSITSVGVFMTFDMWTRMAWPPSRWAPAPSPPPWTSYRMCQRPPCRVPKRRRPEVVGPPAVIRSGIAWPSALKQASTTRWEVSWLPPTTGASGGGFRIVPGGTVTAIGR